MLKLLAASAFLWTVAGGTFAGAQAWPSQLPYQPSGQPMDQMQPIQPYQPVAPAYQQPGLAVSPEGQPMGVVVPFSGTDSSGGTGVVVSPDGQPVGVVPGQ